MKIPFNIKYRPQIESGEYKVETIDGNPVRIICWDRHNENKPLIVALISAPACDALSNYFQDGKPLSTDSPLLFIITPEPELTEFEQGVRDMIVSALTTTHTVSDGQVTSSVVMDYNTVRLLAAGLLKLAKKELIRQWNEDMKNEYARGKKDGITIGYNDAMKKYNEAVSYHYPTCEPPCFHGGPCTNPMLDCINCPRRSSGTTNTSATNKAE